MASTLLIRKIDIFTSHIITCSPYIQIFILKNSNYSKWESKILSVVGILSQFVVMVESGILTIIEHDSIESH